MHCNSGSVDVADYRLSLGLVVLLVGVWYCYKRGREERLKAGVGGPSEGPVEGLNPQDGNAINHGDGMTTTGSVDRQ